MNIKSLFSRKKEEVKVELPTFYPKTYTMGYEIHTTDGTIHKKYFDTVPEDQRQAVRNAIDADVKEMENALNTAASKKKEFVNLGGCVFRMKDFSKISIFDTVDIN
jgi:TRAP-type mannitol/chloroaromatic compound transport system substrate-binding protein